MGPQYRSRAQHRLQRALDRDHEQRRDSDSRPGSGSFLDFCYNIFGQPGWTRNVVAGRDTTYSAPSIATMTNDEAVIAVQGPDHSLRSYYNHYATPGWPLNIIARKNTTESTTTVAAPRDYNNQRKYERPVNQRLDVASARSHNLIQRSRP